MQSEDPTGASRCLKKIYRILHMLEYKKGSMSIKGFSLKYDRIEIINLIVPLICLGILGK